MTEDAQSPSAGNSDQAENAPVTPRLPTRRIWLCADDYGISPGVSEAIRELIARGRLNATSAMVVAPSFGPSAALQLSNRTAGKAGVAIGLHLTMTAPFRPLTAFAPVTKDGTFPPISDMLVRAFWPQFDRALVAREVEAQIDAFVAAFGRPPDFVDGHHHVHLLPRISEAVLAAIKRVNSAAWARQCGQVTPLAARVHDRKGIVIEDRHDAPVDEADGAALVLDGVDVEGQSEGVVGQRRRPGDEPRVVAAGELLRMDLVFQALLVDVLRAPP